MNRLLQCTLGALVVSQIIPYLPPPYPNICAQSSGNTTMHPRIYTQAEKTYLTESATWNPQFGYTLWHRFQGNQVLWFANPAVQNFLAILLSPNENSTYTLGVRWAKKDQFGHVLSWGPVTELDNDSVLVLVAKILASVSAFAGCFPVVPGY